VLENWFGWVVTERNDEWAHPRWGLEFDWLAVDPSLE